MSSTARFLALPRKRWRRVLVVAGAAGCVLLVSTGMTLRYGNPQWQRLIYIWQAYVSPGYVGDIPPPADFTGVWKTWYRNGRLRSRVAFRDGVLHGECALWYVNGQIADRARCVESGYDGERIQWYPNGQLRMRTPFVNGVAHGEEVTWYEDGAVKSRRLLEDHCQKGILRAWDNQGKLMYEDKVEEGKHVYRRSYKNGDLVHEETYEHDGTVLKRIYRDGKLVRENRLVNGKVVEVETYQEAVGAKTEEK